MQLLKSNNPITDQKFIELIEAKKTSFYRIAYGYVRNQEDALEIVQEAVCKAFIGKDKLRNSQLFYPWFYRILSNTAVSFLRVNKHLVTLSDCGEPAAHTPNQDELLCLEEELSRLSPRCRKIIIFKFYEDMTFNEIAQVLNKPESTVKSEYYRGLKLLKERMEAHG